MKVLPWAGGEDARRFPHFKAGLRGTGFAADSEIPERWLANHRHFLKVFM
jgi:hypothetical protein